MPRNVRNFWIDLSVDGRDSRIKTGPVRKDDGFDMTIRMRAQGGISDTVLLISGTASVDGALELTAVEKCGQAIHQTLTILSER